MALDIQQILLALKNESGAKLPPVQLWQPKIVGEIDIQIDGQMRWIHEGGYFERFAVQRLLSSLLRMDGENYYLVTPQEKLKISVADVPFEISSMIESETGIGQKLLITNCEDIISLGDNSQWQLREYQGNAIPYVEVRNNLWARVSRHVYYQMIEQAEIEEQGGTQTMTFVSSGSRFLLGELQEG